jgi:mxaJ protein
MAAVVATIALTGVSTLPATAWELRVCADPDYLPFSHRELTGYENRIAEILADELGADLTFKWATQAATMVSEQLREGECDIIIGLPETRQGVLPTIAYYRSPYVFVYRADKGFDLMTFDDPIVGELRFGVQASGDAPHGALAQRGYSSNVDIDLVGRDRNPAGPFATLVDAVARDEIDVAIPWGPVGAYHAAQQPVELKVVPTPPFEMPMTEMFRTIVMGVRHGDQSLRDLIDIAIAERWDEINAVLDEYGVPTMPLARPVRTLAGN